MIKTLLKIYGKIVAYSFFTTLILATIVGIVQSYFAEPSQSMRNCIMPFFTELLSVGLASVVALSTIMIFINLNEKIRTYNITNFLSFFILPFVIGIFSIISVVPAEGAGFQTILFLIVSIGTPLFFIRSEYLKFKNNV